MLQMNCAPKYIPEMKQRKRYNNWLILVNLAISLCNTYLQVYAALSSQNWGASTSQLGEIANETFE